MTHVVIVPGGIGGTGGLSVDVRNLATGLAARGHGVTVVGVAAGDASLDDLADPSASLRLLRPTSLARRFGLYAGIGRILRSRPGAVVHVFGCMPSYLTLATLLAARSRGNRVVWTPMFHPLRERVWRSRRRLFPMLAFDRVAPLAGRLADAVGAATEAEAEVFRRAGARRVLLLPPVVEPTEPIGAAACALLRERIGVGDAPLVCVVASRDEPRKGLAFCREAFAALSARMPRARLLLVGLEQAPPWLPTGATSLGRVDDRTLACALRAADVVFVPSLFEAFSRVVIEAWQQETPVVVSDGVALAPLAAAIGGGIAVPYGDVSAAAAALAALLDDSDCGRVCGRAGHSIVARHFALETLLGDLEPVYVALAASVRVRARNVCAGRP